MKKIFLFLSFFFIVILFSACCTTRIQRYNGKVYIPVYKNLTEVRNEFRNESPKELENPGKIYVFGNYLFINEIKKGIHIVDNSNPSNPKFINFINIPGNGDIAVKGDILYADSYIDLLAIDISNPLNSKLVKRIEGIFPNPLTSNQSYLDPEKGLLVDFIVRDTVYEYVYKDCGDMFSSPIDVESRRNTSGGSGGGLQGPGAPSGIGGSMARFTIYKNYLYAVDHSHLQTFDISSPDNPLVWAKINVGREIETIFPFKDKLFIGSTTGMFIYDNSVPWNPRQVGQFSHARGCDPVVANDTLAFVTLRSGTQCPGNQNQLDILDIKDLFKPKLIATYPMQEPAGLGIDDNILFICDGKAGLKVFDFTNPKNIKLLSWQSDFNTYDIIPLGAYAIVIGNDGLYQFDYKNPEKLILLSKIKVKK